MIKNHKWDLNKLDDFWKSKKIRIICAEHTQIQLFQSIFLKIGIGIGLNLSKLSPMPNLMLSLWISLHAKFMENNAGICCGKC